MKEQVYQKKIRTGSHEFSTTVTLNDTPGYHQVLTVGLGSVNDYRLVDKCTETALMAVLTKHHTRALEFIYDDEIASGEKLAVLGFDET